MERQEKSMDALSLMKSDMSIPIYTSDKKPFVLHTNLAEAEVHGETFEFKTTIGYGGVAVYVTIDGVTYSTDLRDFIETVLTKTRGATGPKTDEEETDG